MVNLFSISSYIYDRVRSLRSFFRSPYWCLFLESHSVKLSTPFTAGTTNSLRTLTQTTYLCASHSLMIAASSLVMHHWVRLRLSILRYSCFQVLVPLYGFVIIEKGKSILVGAPPCSTHFLRNPFCASKPILGFPLWLNNTWSHYYFQSHPLVGNK